VTRDRVKFRFGTQTDMNTVLNIILKCRQLQRHEHATEVMCENSDVAKTWTSVNDAHMWIMNCAVISLYLWLTLQQRSV